MSEAATPPPHLDPPEIRYEYEQPREYPSGGWLLAQLLPSPELGIGQDLGATHVAPGLRWQLTPILWSWGVNHRVSGWRFFVVDPLARMSGSIALVQHFEWFFGYVSKPLARPGLEATFPLLGKGEQLAFSLGTSFYSYDDRPRIAHDIGIYTLFDTIGAVATISPDNKALTTIATLRIRYF